MLGRLLDARHLLPSGEGLRTDRPGVGGGQKVPTTAKQIVDGGVSSEEPLSMARGFKPPHLPFLLPGRLMGKLSSVI